MKDLATITNGIELKSSTISLRSDGIIQFLIKPNTMVTKQDAEEIVASAGIVGYWQKHPVLIIAGEYTLAEEETRIYAASEEANRFTIANAFVLHSLAQRLMGNIYLKINNPVTPTKMFTDEKSAIKWLSQFNPKN